MPSPNNVQLRPPGDWDEFENICADVFSREWNDPNVVRYGRQGQRQNGVDIYGRENDADVGAQCKGKRTWPPTKLTTAEVDAEVEEAKMFRPKLKKLIIATTAENDTHITDHVNAISARHAKRGLFRIYVYGWKEIIRRIRNHPDLLQTHFDIYTLSRVREDLGTVSGKVTSLSEAVQRLQPTQTAAVSGTPDAALPQAQHGFPQEGLVQALERDFWNRLSRALQRSLFPETVRTDEFIALAEEALTSGTVVSQELRRRILLRATRAAAVRNQLEDARRYLDTAQCLTGSAPDGPAQARLAVAEGRVDEGIQILRDATDEESRSVLLNILTAARGDTSALEWVAQESLVIAAFSPAGLLNLCQIYLRRDDVEKVKEVLAQATPQQLQDGPYLYYLRGAIRFASVMPTPERALVLTGLPLDVRTACPVLYGPQLATELDAAANDFRQALPLALGLGLQEASRIIEAYLTWIDLLHPVRKEAARDQLRRDMRDPRMALSRVQFAFAYDQDFDSAELLAYLSRRERLGGLSSDEFRALLSIRLNQSDARGIVDLIAKHRDLAEQAFSRIGMLSLEIQALARTGDATSARLVLEQNAGAFDREMVAAFRVDIAKAEGADPVAEHLKLYEETKTTESLRALIAVLMDRRDQNSIGRYAELLYADTHAPQDMALAAQAFVHAGDDANFMRLYETHPFIKDIDPEFARHYAWQLFRLGRQREAKNLAEEIARQHPDRRDLDLEIAIALETGEWETLAGPLAVFLETADRRSGVSLIRAADLARMSGQGPLMDLIAAAMKQDDTDPQVLLGGYTIFVEEGLEDTRSEAQEWFTKALALSGPDGPIQRFELKDLLARQATWNEHSQSIQEHVSRGDMPMVVASGDLNTTVIDVVLRNLIRNTRLEDARRRVAIPLFSGRRKPSAPGNDVTASFDITALLVLGWLGILPQALEAYPRVVLPAGILVALFEGRKRIRQGQRSRLRKAEEIRDAIARGHLKVLRAPAIARDNLSAEVGIELAALLREAGSTKGLVVRSAPVRRIGIEDAEVDLSAYADRLCDMHAVLKVLAELNVVDEHLEKTAKQYFDLQDRGWTSSAEPQAHGPVFLDGLSVTYLQTTGLWQIFLRTFRNVYIHDSTAEEAVILIENDQYVSEAFRVIDDIRVAVRKANAEGRITFGPRRLGTADGERDYDIGSTLNLLADLCNADIAYFDDRALNKETITSDRNNHRAKAASTLDLIEELRLRGVLNEQQRRTLQYRLRTGGAMLMSVDADEIEAAARRNQKNQSPEFRAIQDSLDLARLAEMPQFPAKFRGTWPLSMRRRRP